MADNFTRRDFIKTLSLGAAAIALPTVSASAADKPAKPNIIMILTDDQGYGDLSSYGAKDLKTPHTDALVTAGVRMDSFYANCPVCSPTRAALLTGRYPDLVGVPGVIRTYKRSNWGHMTAGAVLLPKLLKPAGYHTAIVGKWHLGLEAPNTPIPRGFDHFHGYLGDMMDDYYKHRRHGINYMTLGEKTIDPKGHATDLFTQWAVDYVKDRAKSPKQPFFLYLAYNAPHTPIQPPKDWLQKVKDREKGISAKRAKLVALIEHLDNGIGKVMAALKETRQADNTLIIFTSDNGGQGNVGANNGGMKGAKQQMDEGGIRVPMCAVWPGKIKPGTKCDQVAMTMDLFPTICQAAGAKIGHTIDGVSILDGLLGKKFEIPERYLFWMRLEGGHYKGKIYHAARHGRYKLTQNRQNEKMKLYDLEKDPGERKPLGEDHEAYKRLSDALAKHIAEANKIPWQRPGK